MSGIYHENKLWANVSGPNVAGATPSENLSTLTIDGVTYDTTELVFCYDDNGSLYTDSTKATTVTGDESKLYIATNTGKQYRYNGSAFSALGVNAINDLSDVTITSASDGQALEYDATAGKWKNVAKKAADTPTFSEASTRANLSGSGETMATILGKIKKWFTDLKDLAFIGKDGTSSTKYLRGDGTWQNFPTIPTKTSDLTNDSGFVTTDEKVTGELKNPSSGSWYYVPFIGTANQKPYYNNGLRCVAKEGTASADGEGSIILGNDTASGTAGNKKGYVGLYANNSRLAYLHFGDSATADRAFALPDKSGTVALTSDITDEKVTAELFNPSSGVLQYVPFLGSTNNQKPRVNDGIRYNTKEGTTSADGYGQIYLGNGVQTGTAGNKKGSLVIYSEKNGYVDLRPTASSTTGRNIFFPDASGVVRLYTTYEYDIEWAIPGSASGHLLLGKFPCYDSNVTIEITSTTNTTRSATVVLGTQNINDSHAGSWTFSTYGDENNAMTPLLYMVYPQNSRYIEIYFSGGKYSKNTFHIQCVSLAAAPTNMMENVSEIPSGATNPTNVVDYYYFKKTGGTITGTTKFTGAIQTTGLAEFSGSPTYLLGIEPFTSGGDVKWKNISGVKVNEADKATKDGDGNTISSTYLKNSNVLMKNGDANVSPAGYRNIGGTNDYITLSEAGTYLITAWAMFKGGTGNKAVLICRASDNAAYGQSWESSTINQSYPKTFTCFHVATVTSTTLYFRARVYTENTDVYGGISGGIYAIKVS